MSFVQMVNSQEHQFAEVGIYAFPLPVSVEATSSLPKYSKDFTFLTSVFFGYPNFELAIASLHSTLI